MKVKHKKVIEKDKQSASSGISQYNREFILFGSRYYAYSVHRVCKGGHNVDRRSVRVTYPEISVYCYSYEDDHCTVVDDVGHESEISPLCNVYIS